TSSLRTRCSSSVAIGHERWQAVFHSRRHRLPCEKSLFLSRERKSCRWLGHYELASSFPVVNPPEDIPSIASPLNGGDKAAELVSLYKGSIAALAKDQGFRAIKHKPDSWSK